ncbi:hypothetical protein BDV10DRAFT_175301, partial [Aspergillus recurvatus]
MRSGMPLYPSRREKCPRGAGHERLEFGATIKSTICTPDAIDGLAVISDSTVGQCDQVECQVTPRGTLILCKGTSSLSSWPLASPHVPSSPERDMSMPMLLSASTSFFRFTGREHRVLMFVSTTGAFACRFCCSRAARSRALPVAEFWQNDHDH